MRNRSFRIHTEERQKNRVKKYIKETWCRINGEDLSTDIKRVGKQSHVRGICSCWMCGNPRKYWNKKTRQEILAEM